MGGVTRRFNFAPLRSVRALIAARVLADKDDDATVLGSITLKPHQVSAIRRIDDAIATFGGAILSDPVGTGKTFIALGCMRQSQSVLVVAPAVLRDMWQSAGSAARRPIEFVSYETLSRRRGPSRRFDFIVLDEAHHARNPITARYAALSQLAATASVLMLTATPIHNRRRDLISLLQLVMGDEAHRLADSDLSQCVIRRDALASELDIPKKAGMVWHQLSADDAIPRRILSLPPPLPTSDGGDAGILVSHSLIRQWASSDAALRGALRRRLVRATALISALEDGAWPSRADLSQWIAGDDSVQLSFAGFLASLAPHDARLLDDAKAHRDGIVALLSQLDSTASVDDERAGIINRIRDQHSGERIVVFSTYSDTIDAMFKRLSPSGGVAALTSSGGRVAGGPITRAHAIAQYSPQATNVKAAEKITLLLSTDLLSEGVNLQNASVVIHLDLPWTPARIEQRLGRIARVGSRHSRVVSHAFRPYKDAESTIHIEDILRAKTRDVSEENKSRRHSEEIRTLLSTWSEDVEEMPIPVVAGVIARVSGCLAMTEGPSGVRLVVSSNGDVTESPSRVLEFLRVCGSPERTVATATVARHFETVGQWAASTAALNDDGSGDKRTSIRGTVLQLIADVTRAAKPHERARIAMLSSKARQGMRGRLTNYHDALLRAHTTAFVPRAEWLHALLDILSSSNSPAKSRDTKIIALIVAEKEMRCHAQRNADALSAHDN